MSREWNDSQPIYRQLRDRGVHMILDGDHQREWKDDESRMSRIVFIGRKLSQESIRAGFESCLA